MEAFVSKYFHMFMYQACCLNITFSVLLWTFRLVECFCFDLMNQEVEQQKSKHTKTWVTISNRTLLQ